MTSSVLQTTAQATPSAQATRSDRLWLISILAIAIVLRLIFILVIDTLPALSGGDVPWYFENGLLLIKNSAPPLPPGPIFLLYVGFVQLFFPANTAIAVVRLLNIGWHILLMLSVYSLGKRYFNIQVARLVAFVIAISPIFLIESGSPVTESIFMGLLFGALAIYAAYQDRPTIRSMALIGVLLGIATLTRAVILAFPFVLVAQLIRLHGWRRSLRFVASLLIAYGLVVSTWTVYNALKWNRFVVGAEGLVGFTWMGINGQKSPTEVDNTIGTDNAIKDRNGTQLQQILQTLQTKLPDYMKLRASNLFSAYLQPHNTEYFPGESLKDAAITWLSTDRSLTGLAELTRKNAFWPKLALYIVHFWALSFGLIGMLLVWPRFWIVLPLVGYVLYTTAVHSVLLALPRYIFPIEPVYILFAAYATLALIREINVRRSPQLPPSVDLSTASRQ